MSLEWFEFTDCFPRQTHDLPTWDGEQGKQSVRGAFAAIKFRYLFFFWVKGEKVNVMYELN